MQQKSEKKILKAIHNFSPSFENQRELFTYLGALFLFLQQKNGKFIHFKSLSFNFFSKKMKYLRSNKRIE